MAVDGSGSFGNSSPLGSSPNDNQQQLQSNFSKLSSGLSVTNAADDAIAGQLQGDAVVLGQANNNIGDAQQAINVANSALQQVGDITDQLQELATEASNGTLNDQQRSELNDQYQQLTQQIQQIGQTTDFNGQPLLEGQSISVQAGDDGSSSSQLSTGGVDLSSLASALTSQAIDTAGGAQSALTALSNFASSLSSAQSDFGAASVELSAQQSVNSSAEVNDTAAQASIQDADVAQTTADTVSLQIKQQADTALNAQAANLTTQAVQDLLK